MHSMFPFPGQDKVENFKYGLSCTNLFCTINHIEYPKINININRISNVYGLYYYSQSTIVIDIKKVLSPVKTPGFRWSYTGYKADLTAAGVLAHEFGHYVDDVLKNPSRKMKRFVKGESCVTSYEPNSCECFAEAMKLFVLNPDLLRQGRPKRYEFISNLELKPCISEPWEVVLQHAHPKIIAAAKNWIKK